MVSRFLIREEVMFLEVTKEPRVLLVPKELKELKEIRVIQVVKVLKVLRVVWDSKEHRVPKEG